MNLLINGMDMPKNCKDCPCREYGKFSYEPDWCCLNRKNIVNAETISPNCPLSEIPSPHGRLIDADELIKQYSVSGEEALEMMAENMEAFRMTYKLAKRIRNQINQASTIIEAEE